MAYGLVSSVSGTPALFFGEEPPFFSPRAHEVLTFLSGLFPLLASEEVCFEDEHISALGFGRYFGFFWWFGRLYRFRFRRFRWPDNAVVEIRKALEQFVLCPSRVLQCKETASGEEVFDFLPFPVDGVRLQFFTFSFD